MSANLATESTTVVATRQSVLNERHRALGSKLDGEIWNGMPLPESYTTNADDEVVAVRTRAGLYDVTALNIVNVTGPAALKVLDKLVTIDVTKLEPGSCRLAGEVNDAGALVDDIMVICDAKDTYRLSHGSGATQTTLAELAKGEDVTIEQDLDVHILSLQGPKAIDILNPEVDFDLAALPYFKHVNTTLFGCDIMLSRGGYSGEQGYEVYCKAADAVKIWDTILEKGQPFGAIACSWNSLDLTRVEASLLFFPFDMPEGDTTPWEVNMHWCVDEDKPGDYIGKEAVLNLKGRERFKQIGLECDCKTAVPEGAKLMVNGKEVGVITSPSYSRYLMKSIALAHIKPEYSQFGTQVTLVADDEVKARIVKMPFYDPMRARTHPE
ncbi:MAG TPA: aminomethyl transferase family protein [Methylophaga aminisulfidivorans]|uniref:Aminomethyl transferase family protein n=1 Tax=Methylophaga aminisulfidivorans TaxID=230105 RepID=A0A7C1W122_9GAMM|nr:aminomethyl transferase family protein [Methylophaga aminisulfidivorans]